MKENESLAGPIHQMSVRGFRPKGVKGSILFIATGLVAVVSTFLSKYFSRKEEVMPMKKEPMSIRVICSSLFDFIAASGTIAIGDALLT
jgi:hypothetical protein